MKRGRFWRWAALIVAGLFLYAVLLVVSLPAEYVARAVHTFNNDVLLQQTFGSAWNGGAMLVGKRNGKQLGQLRWKIHPWRLFTGTLTADIEFSGNAIDARAAVDAGLHKYRLSHVTASAPAATLSQFYPAIALAGISGQLLFNAESIELNASDIRGAGELVWTDAATRLIPLDKIGTYRLTLTGQGDHIAMLLSTTQGALRAAGNGEWRLFADGMLRVNGTLSPASPEPVLDSLLNAIGPAQADGAHRFSFETRVLLTKN
jgi:hypothetical protein